MTHPCLYREKTELHLPVPDTLLLWIRQVCINGILRIHRTYQLMHWIGCVLPKKQIIRAWGLFFFCHETWRPNLTQLTPTLNLELMPNLSHCATFQWQNNWFDLLVVDWTFWGNTWQVGPHIILTYFLPVWSTANLRLKNQWAKHIENEGSQKKTSKEHAWLGK